MRVKRVLATFVATVSIIALSACGAGGGQGEGQTDTKADKGLKTLGVNVKYNPNHLVNKGKPIQLEYWSWVDKEQDPISAMTRDYQKIHPNVTFKIVNVAWADYWTKVPLALKGKNGPALFAIHNSQDALLKPYMAPIDIPADQLKADYTGVSAHLEKGKAYYIDTVINTGNIYYNKKLWKEANLTDSDIPKTWDQLVTVAQKLTKWDGSKMVQSGFNLNGDEASAGYPGLWQGLNYQKGELMFDSSGTKPNYKNETTKENMQFIKDLYDKYKVASTAFGVDMGQSFGNGQTAMVYQWGGFAGTLKLKYPDIDYGVFATPTFSEQTPFAYDRYNGESTPGVNKNQSKEQQEAAQDFLKYILANDKFIKDDAKAFNSFPAKKSLQNDSEILSMPIMAAIKPRIDRLIWPGPTPSTMESSAKKSFQDVFQNHKSIDSALDSTQALMEKDIKGTGFKSLEPAYAFYKEARR
ncbi:extracellular solute-binding protein [Bifidobacterium apis]|uniref:extracellular solute-binding protein n=1 Tax=Bifidobacterium apis TaxID=3081440 RepID=UPI0030DA213B